MYSDLNISVLIGKTIISIVNKDNQVLEFKTNDGETYVMFDEEQSYGNESRAYLEDIAGDLSDLLHKPILVAEERKNHDAPKVKNSDGEVDDWYKTLWTFYELATIKGSVTLRWYSTSSPYYAAAVNFRKIK